MWVRAYISKLGIPVFNSQLWDLLPGCAYVGYLTSLSVSGNTYTHTYVHIHTCILNRPYIHTIQESKQYERVENQKSNFFLLYLRKCDRLYLPLNWGGLAS